MSRMHPKRVLDSMKSAQRVGKSLWCEEFVEKVLLF